MNIIAQILIGIIAVLHAYILWLEMFAWESRGPKVFADFERELFPKTKVMAGNQGLYNGFLAGGLVWSLLVADLAWKTNIATYFLICVAIAGAYGAATASRRILYVQTVPAVIALIFVHLV
ncbi:DUF1304 domain-containing protein [Actibacterium lipolyticum]|uniref:DUF1304 domain-containing protein n=1 Tax=Actibacterium lipolyticum TaxID=1524263 RepID=A0A238KJR0_9RHOB|nr:DUF1304 domain-containing protein [Actibacterium lipolyticum]SMX43023.1 hypothetical protein COL8621_02183 [Actibacterium lipolyticum]